EAGDEKSVGPKGKEKRASAVVFRDSLCPVDRHGGRLASPGRLSSDPGENPSGIPDGNCLLARHGQPFCPPPGPSASWSNSHSAPPQLRIQRIFSDGILASKRP